MHPLDDLPNEFPPYIKIVGYLLGNIQGCFKHTFLRKSVGEGATKRSAITGIRPKLTEKVVIIPGAGRNYRGVFPLRSVGNLTSLDSMSYSPPAFGIALRAIGHRRIGARFVEYVRN